MEGGRAASIYFVLKPQLTEIILCNETTVDEDKQGQGVGGGHCILHAVFIHVFV